MRIDLSVVIPNRDGMRVIGDCLETLPGALGGLAAEVVVVDNGSSDGSIELVESAYPFARSIRLGANLGFARACNEGAAATSGDYLLFLNSDTLLEPLALESMLGRARRLEGTGVAAFGPVLSGPDGAQAHSFGRFPTVFGQFVVWLGESRSLEAERAAIREAVRLGADSMAVDYVTGAALLVRRAAFKEVGGFDERFFMYFEDAELQLRMAASGFSRRVLLIGGVAHLGGGGDARSRRTRVATYESLLTYHAIRLPRLASRAFVPLFCFYILCNILHPGFEIRENLAFVARMLSRVGPVLRMADEGATRLGKAV